MSEEANAVTDALGKSPAGRKRKNLLLIAFDFPPRRTSGVYRPTALTKYLSSCGWRVTVLTIQADGQSVQDSTLLQKLPSEVTVVRTRYSAIDGWERSVGTSVKSLRILATPTNANGGQPTFFSRCLRLGPRLARSVLYFPDNTAGWVPWGLVKALGLLRAEQFDAIYTTHPPRSAHVLGLLLKILTGIPWVAEFRDPWVLPLDEENISGLKVPAPRRNRWLQTQIFHRADALVTVTSNHAEELERIFHAPHEKLTVIPNGFDEDDFSHPLVAGCDLYEPGYVHLSHFGTIYPKFSGRFFPALAELVKELPWLGKRLRIHVIGYPDEDVQRYANQAEVLGMVQFHRVVEHSEALKAMYSSDGLLLFYGHAYTSRTSVPGKLYEYLRVGRPILAIAHEGGVKELIRQGNAGWVVMPNNTAAIKQVIRELLLLVENASPAEPRLPQFVGQFRYDRLANQLAALLNSLTD